MRLFKRQMIPMAIVISFFAISGCNLTGFEDMNWSSNEILVPMGQNSSEHPMDSNSTPYTQPPVKQYTISGIVIDSITQMPLKSAIVYISQFGSKQYMTVTSQSGRYSQQVPESYIEYYIRAVHSGYVTKSLSTKVRSSKVINFGLIPVGN